MTRLNMLPWSGEKKKFDKGYKLISSVLLKPVTCNDVYEMGILKASSVSLFIIETLPPLPPLFQLLDELVQSWFAWPLIGPWYIVSLWLMATRETPNISATQVFRTFVMGRMLKTQTHQGSQFVSVIYKAKIKLMTGSWKVTKTLLIGIINGIISIQINTIYVKIKDGSTFLYIPM